MLIAFNFRFMIVWGTVRLWFAGILKSATTEKWSKIISDVATERTSPTFEENRKIKRMKAEEVLLQILPSQLLLVPLSLSLYLMTQKSGVSGSACRKLLNRMCPCPSV